MTIDWEILEAFAAAHVAGDDRKAVQLRDAIIGEIVRIEQVALESKVVTPQDFNSWMRRAYRSEPGRQGESFTLYNMNVAYVAGANRAEMKWAESQRQIHELETSLRGTLAMLEDWQAKHA